MFKIKIKMERITPKYIKVLKENEVFTFGSNRQGRHSLGAALTARKKFGAIYGQSRGLQGQSYAIITKELRNNYESVTLEEIKKEINIFIQFTKSTPHLTFLVTEIGCGLAGLKPKDIAPLFQEAKDIENIHLPERFWRLIK